MRKGGRLHFGYKKHITTDDNGMVLGVLSILKALTPKNRSYYFSKVSRFVSVEDLSEVSELRIIRLDSEATRFLFSLPEIIFDSGETTIDDLVDKPQLTYTNLNEVSGIYYTQTERSYKALELLEE